MADYPTIEGPIRSNREASDWGLDPDSGARVIRLTTGPGMSHNIYCEEPYGSPDGKRLLVTRTHDMLAPHRQLLVADIEPPDLRLVEPDIPSESIAHAPWGEWAYYPMHDGSVRRVSLLTLERQAVLPAGTLRPLEQDGLASVTPDGRQLMGAQHYDGPGLRTFAMDAHTGERRILCEGPDNTNPHVQADPGGMRRCLYQLIRDGRPPGIAVIVKDLDGPGETQLPFGGERSAESTGHMAWVADTGRVACVVNCLRDERRHDPRHPEGNLLVAAPGDKEAAAFPASEHAFYHVSISRCGRYFVCDDFMDFRADAFACGVPGPVRIVVGNLETGKHRTLIRDCQDYGIAGSSRYEPDPYFTADSRYVIYNASPFGTMQVFAAEVPDGFLRSIDG